MNRLLYSIIFFLMFPIENCFSKDNNTILNWNQTDRHLPVFVKDSIQNYYNSIGMEDCLFIVNGKGMSEDKSDIDGIYTLRRFSSHGKARLMLVFHSDVYIVKSLNYGGVVAEICRFATEKQIDNIILKRMCLDCFLFLANNYSENNDKDFVASIDSMSVDTTKNRIFGIYEDLLANNNIASDLPFYILTKELDEKDTIMLLGLLGGFNFDKAKL